MPPLAKTSIGRSLLVQLCVFEVISVAFFTYAGADLLAGIIAPLCGAAHPLSELPLWSAFRSPFVIVSTVLAWMLLGITLVAWLCFHSRLWAHTALGLYSLLSMFIMVGFLI